MMNMVRDMSFTSLTVDKGKENLVIRTLNCACRLAWAVGINLVGRQFT